MTTAKTEISILRLQLNSARNEIIRPEKELAAIRNHVPKPHFTEAEALDQIKGVKESYRHGWHHLHGSTNFAVIVPAITGRPPRYHVYRIDRLDGTIRRVGCELPLHEARAVARRPKFRDGEPLTGGELKVGRWTMTKWKREESLYPM